MTEGSKGTVGEPTPRTAEWADTIVETRPLPRKRRPLLAAAAGVALAALFAGVVWFAMHRAPLTPAPAPAPEAPGRALSDQQLEHMVAQAHEQTEKDPRNITAWAMLAHSYDMLGRFAESSKAYAKLVELRPGDAQVLADYADALGVANGRTLAGEPTALIDKALALDPKNVKALTLAGTAALEEQHFDKAVEYWERARALSHDARFTQQIDAGLAQARALAKGKPASEVLASAAAQAPKPAPGKAFVAGRVSLSDDLRAKAPPDAVVFVFARPIQGSRMPVALLRKHVRDLPLDFTLDDSMAMVPAAKLSKEPVVVIGARISLRGDVMPQAGDMEGWSAPVNVGARGVKLEITEVIK